MGEAPAGPPPALRGGCAVVRVPSAQLTAPSPRRFCMQKCVSLVPGVTLDLIEK